MATCEQELLELKDLHKNLCLVATYQLDHAHALEERNALRQRVINAPYTALPVNHCKNLDEKRTRDIADAKASVKKKTIFISILFAIIMCVILYTPLALFSLYILLIGIAVIWSTDKKMKDRAQAKVDLSLRVPYEQARIKDQEIMEENKRRQKAAQDALLEKLLPDFKSVEVDIAFSEDAIAEFEAMAKENRLYSVLSENDKIQIDFLIQQIETGRADSLKEALNQLDHKREVDDRNARDSAWRREDEARKDRERAEDLEREEQARRDAERRYREEVERQERNRREDIARQEQQRYEDQKRMEYEMNRLNRKLEE